MTIFAYWSSLGFLESGFGYSGKIWAHPRTPQESMNRKPGHGFLENEIVVSGFLGVSDSWGVRGGAGILK